MTDVVTEQAQSAPAAPAALPGGTLWLVLAAVSSVRALITATTSLSDPDLPWHLEAGEQILDQRTVTGLGADWSYVLQDASWTTTQWGSEVVMSLVDSVAGLRGQIVVQLALTVAFTYLLARLLLRRRDPFWGAAVFSLAAFATAPFLQARPQLASLPLLVWLSRRAFRTLSTGAAFARWSTVAVTFLWANLHGLWVMVPATLGLLACCAVVDRRWWQVRSLLTTGGLAVLAAGLTPVGPALLLSPLRFAQATGRIAEWQPTTPRDLSALALDVILLLFVLAWVRSRTAVPPAEVVFVLVLLAFALLAYRNIGPAALLLAPVLRQRLDVTFPRPSTPDSVRERRVMLVLASSVLAGGLLASVARAATTDVLSPELPRRLAERLAADGAPHRVLNDYNVGGTLVRWGGEQVTVAIDGRADYYGARRIEDHLELLNLLPGWPERLAAQNPDRAVLTLETPITGQLMAMGWTELDRQGEYVLLARP